MNWVDWLVVALLLLGIIQGVLRGWQGALLGILVVALAYLGTSALLPLFASGVATLPLEAHWARTIAFGIVLVGLYVILSLVANALLASGRRAKLETQVPGGLLGLLRGAALAMAVLGVLAATPEGEVLQQDINASRLGRPLLAWQQQAMAFVHQRVPWIPPIGPDRRI